MNGFRYTAGMVIWLWGGWVWSVHAAGSDTSLAVWSHFAEERVFPRENRTFVGGYGEVVYTRLLDGGAVADVEFRRFIIFLDHYFNSWVSFQSELELEHGSELALEQAFLEMRVRPYLQIRSGLLLVPMSIINLYHEPTYFPTIYRPFLDRYLIPSTWREFGVGLAGYFRFGLKYYAYLLAGMNSETMVGSSFVRKGRQGGGKLKGNAAGNGKVIVNQPAVTLRLDYSTPVAGLQVGAAVYRSGLDNRKDGIKTGSVLTLVSLNASYQHMAWELTGQWVAGFLSRVDQMNRVNQLTPENALAARATGYNVSVAFDLLSLRSTPTSIRLLPFYMFEKLNLHDRIPVTAVKNGAYNSYHHRMGLVFKPAENAVYKLEYRISGTELPEDVPRIYMQLGVGYNF